MEVQDRCDRTGSEDIGLQTKTLDWVQESIPEAIEGFVFAVGLASSPCFW